MLHPEFDIYKSSDARVKEGANKVPSQAVRDTIRSRSDRIKGSSN